MFGIQNTGVVLQLALLNQLQTVAFLDPRKVKSCRSLGTRCTTEYYFGSSPVMTG